MIKSETNFCIELSEGVRRVTPNGWSLAIPEREGPVTQHWAEAVRDPRTRTTLMISGAEQAKCSGTWQFKELSDIRRLMTSNSGKRGS